MVSDKVSDKLFEVDFNAVVAVDFGTTCSGFAFSHRVKPDIQVNTNFPGQVVQKTNTVLQYDNTWQVEAWGYPALAKEPRRRRKVVEEKRPVELFKLYLANIKKKPELPEGLDYKKTITDYLHQMQILIMETINRRWPKLSLSEIRFVFTIPAGWGDHTKEIMRECIFEAGYITEAAAIYCLNILKSHGLEIGDTFLVCDCGGGTVDLTMRTYVGEDELEEETERTMGICGSTYIDKEFIKFLENRVGPGAMREFKEKHYGQLQYMIQNFFNLRVKNNFKDDPAKFKLAEFDIEQYCPKLKQYVSEAIQKKLDENDWIIELQYNDVKAMFDPIVDKILKLIQNQLNVNPDLRCSAIFVVGGFAESPYLISKIRKTFDGFVRTIAVPTNPITSVMKGAVQYGLNKEAVKLRVLTEAYGIEVTNLFKKGIDPIKRKTADGHILKFSRLAKRGDKAAPDYEFASTFYPVYPDQTHISFKVYNTKDNNAHYCDDAKYIGSLRIDLPDPELGLNRPVEFGLRFAEEEIKATARNKTNNRVYPAEFKYVTAG
ncbi:8611_t:CDS:2 [Ambispora gerdemannii]|uniref:8611_t:CDS:1 n=1 Tax=Ambispora gerdemannii TaxID=144530 RepID=A0A9N8YJA2_9GLOM|nr:8611_t:CDS:2 [Ambispora gerdemannii]